MFDEAKRKYAHAHTPNAATIAVPATSFRGDPKPILLSDKSFSSGRSSRPFEARLNSSEPWRLIINRAALRISRKAISIMWPWARQQRRLTERRTFCARQTIFSERYFGPCLIYLVPRPIRWAYYMLKRTDIWSPRGLRRSAQSHSPVNLNGVTTRATA